MCGIYGMFSLNGEPLRHPQLLESMGNSLRHRGPDSSGEVVEPTAALGAQRLRIVDPTDSGDQPFKDRSGNFWLAGNGEIYNAAAIRNRFTRYPFRSKSDIECALPAFLSRDMASLDGKFALALWDAANHTATLMRDRAGENPLFYTMVNGELFVASEIQALLLHPDVSRTIDKDAVAQYFTHGYVLEPRTMFAEIRRVESGSITTISLSGVDTNRYWSIEDIPQSDMRADRATNLVDRALNDAVAQQLNKEGPTGVFLSGGLDSSLLTALASQQSTRLPTFTVKFATNTFDESENARRVADAFSTDHTEVLADDDSLVRAFGFATDRIAEPISDPALLPTLILAEQAAKSLKVILSGEGADELFGGYPTYLGHKLAASYRDLPAKLQRLLTDQILRLPVSHQRVPLEFMLKRFVAAVDSPWVERHSSWFGLNGGSIPSDPHQTLPNFGGRVEHLDFSDGMTKLDYLTYLRDQLLVKVDRATMAYGLEARSPFLDPELTRLAFTLPASLRVRGLTTKWILKEVAKKYLPLSIVGRRKQGLSVPVAALLNGALREETNRLLAPEPIEACGLLRVGILQRMLYEHRAGIADHGRALWAALTFQRWHERWVSGDA